MTEVETVRFKAGDKAKLYREEGRGDGVATVFRLTFQPIMASPSPQVFINNVLLSVGSDYTINLSQGIVLFADIPAENAAIIFEYYATVYTDDEVGIFLTEAGGNTDYATSKMLLAWSANKSKMSLRETLAGGGGMGLVTRDTSLASKELRETAKAFYDMYEVSSTGAMTPAMGLTEVAWTEQTAERIWNQQIIRDYQGAYDDFSAPTSYTPTPTPEPEPEPEPSYDFIYGGDATGATDVTADLNAWLAAHSSNATLALAENGIYKVSLLTEQGSNIIWQEAVNCQLDFRGSKLLATRNPTLPGRSGTDMSATNGSGTVTSATGNFTVDDEGRVISIDGVEYSIQTYVNPTTITIIASAGLSTHYLGTTGTNKSWAIRWAAAHGIFRMNDCQDMVINDPYCESTNGPGAAFVWIDYDQYEAAVSIPGGSNIVINRPKSRYTGGDCVDISPSNLFPTTSVTVNDMDAQYCGRNFGSVKGGHVTFDGGTTDYSGLHGIDFEPNGISYSGVVDNTTIVGIVKNMTIMGYAQLAVENQECAVAAGGNNSATKKPSITVQNNTGKLFIVYVRNTDTVVVTGNTSTTPTDYYYGTSSSPFWLNTTETITGNTGISVHSISDWSPDISPSQTR